MGTGRPWRSVPLPSYPILFITTAVLSLLLCLGLAVFAADTAAETQDEKTCASAVAAGSIIRLQLPRPDSAALIEMPTIGLGGGIFSRNKTFVAEVFRTAFESGYRLVDSATNYHNDEIIGEVMKQFIEEGKATRKDFFIVSKIDYRYLPDDGFEGAYNRTLTTIEDRLAKFSTGYIDLVLLHGTRPENVGSLPSDKRHSVARAVTWQALSKIWKDTSKVRAIGVSNFSPRHIQQLIDLPAVKPALNQIEFHPALQRNETIQFCHEHGIAVQAYGSGGGYPKEGREREGPDILNLRIIHDIARKHNVSAYQVILRWTLQRGVAVIPSSTKSEHQRDNIALFGFELDDEDMARINSLGDVGVEDYEYVTAKEKKRRYPVGKWGPDPKSVYGFMDPEKVA